MHAEAVRWDPDLGVHIVTGHEEGSAVLRGTGWSSDPRLSPLAPPELSQIPPSVLLFMDPPDHTRLRRLLSPAFTPRAIERLRPRVASVVDAVLDGLDGPVDIVSDVGYLVPLAIIAELLDVGSAGAELFREVTPALVRMLELDAGGDDLVESYVAMTEVTMFLTPLLTERRHRPGDDFVSALLAVEDGLSIEEVLATCVLLLAAGHETTANVIANSTLALLRNPDQQAHLVSDPGRAVEELLRLEGAVKLAGRTALTDHELGGHKVKQGEQVFVSIADANRDPRRFPDPERLDLSREPLPHLAFGGGPHFCLGAALARLEITETLTRLFARFPGLELAEPEARWRESTTFHGLAELPVYVSSRV